jgi:hypothetical protein
MEELPLMKALNERATGLRASPKWVAAAVYLGALGCGPASGAKHRLEGSLSTIMNLDYDDAVLAYSGTQFTVSFKRRRTTLISNCIKEPTSCDTPLAVTTRLDPAPKADGGMDVLKGGTTYELPEMLSTGEQRGVISRNVLEDTRTQFPPLDVGEIRIDNVPHQGQGLPLTGNFHVTFDRGIQFASGKTVFSNGFQAQFP